MEDKSKELRNELFNLRFKLQEYQMMQNREMIKETTLKIEKVRKAMAKEMLEKKQKEKGK